MYPLPKIGPLLRQLQRGLWTSQFGENLEVHHRTREVTRTPRLQGQPDLPLYRPTAIEGSKLSHADLRLSSSSPLS